MKYRLLVAVCVKPDFNPDLNRTCYLLASEIPSHNPDLDVTTIFYHVPIARMDTDRTPWARVARARNGLLKGIDLKEYDYVLMLDADVTHYPERLPSELISANPTGVTAPLVLVEDSDRFYDTAAFIIGGASHIVPWRNVAIAGRNLMHEPPYWPGLGPDVWLVPMDCVGTVVMYPAPLLIACGENPFRDHPAFTDHFEICAFALAGGRRVYCHRGLVALHADLPKYGEAWH